MLIIQFVLIFSILVWVVYEQVCIASFDCARLDIAQECITALYSKFPESRRVLKLQAMRLEAMCK